MNAPTNRHERRMIAALHRGGATDGEIREQFINYRNPEHPLADRCDALENIGARHLSVREAAAYLALSVPYLNRLRTTGGGPPFFKVGTRVVYGTASDLDKWLAKHRRTSTSDSGHE